MLRCLLAVPLTPLNTLQDAPFLLSTNEKEGYVLLDRHGQEKHGNRRHRWW
jgi:hypothetical protein